MDFVIVRGNIIMDIRFSDAIQPLIDAIKATGKPIVYLCNTHHYGDHAGGNIAFKEITNKIIAH